MKKRHYKAMQKERETRWSNEPWRYGLRGTAKGRKRANASRKSRNRMAKASRHRNRAAARD